MFDFINHTPVKTDMKMILMLKNNPLLKKYQTFWDVQIIEQ